MWRALALGVGGLALIGLGLWVGLVVSMRTKFHPVLDVRSMNRAVANPRQMVTAGQPAAYASVVHHVGRTTGTHRRTPVVAVPTDDGFAVALPYGPSADWVLNVLAAGVGQHRARGRHPPGGPPRTRSPCRRHYLVPRQGTADAPPVRRPRLPAGATG